jgi:hypothetical protein
LQHNKTCEPESDCPFHRKALISIRNGRRGVSGEE